jgi:hypothetical protein
MDEAAIVRYITETFDNIGVIEATGSRYFYHDPSDDTAPDRRFPFATLVTTDEHDQFSNLNRPSVYRLNVGVRKQTFFSLFGASAAETTDTFDFTALDRIMPHPVYGNMYWVCVLNPSIETFEAVRPLLAEAYEQAGLRHPQSSSTELS